MGIETLLDTYEHIATRLEHLATYGDLFWILAKDYSNMAKHIRYAIEDNCLEQYIREAREQRVGAYYGPFTTFRLKAMYTILDTVERAIQCKNS